MASMKPILVVFECQLIRLKHSPIKLL